jgi:hypothetical protein
MYIADICYPESYLRTPVHELPFPHPKWHVKPVTGEVYEVTSPMLEEYDPEIGCIDSVGEVRESVEHEELDEERVQQLSGWHGVDEERERQTVGKRRLEDEERPGETKKRSRRS